MGITRDLISDLENERRAHISVAELVAIAAALEVAPIDLLVPPEREGPPVEVLPTQFLHPVKAAEWFCSGATIPTVAVLRHKVAELSRMLNVRAEGERES